MKLKTNGDKTKSIHVRKRISHGLFFVGLGFEANLKVLALLLFLPIIINSKTDINTFK